MITSVLAPEVSSEAKARGGARPPIKCVFLTSRESEFRAAAAILSSTRIFLHHAATLEQAEFQLARTRARVLLTELKFPDGSWEDAVDMLLYSYPQAALVLAAPDPDDTLWIHALERGAFDLVAKPFRAEELRRILENADAHSRMSTPGRAPRSGTRPASGSSADRGEIRSAGSS